MTGREPLRRRPDYGNGCKGILRFPQRDAPGASSLPAKIAQLSLLPQFGAFTLWSAICLHLGRGRFWFFFGFLFQQSCNLLPLSCLAVAPRGSRRLGLARLPFCAGLGIVLR